VFDSYIVHFGTIRLLFGAKISIKSFLIKF